MEKIITKRKLSGGNRRTIRFVVFVGTVGFSFVKDGDNKVLKIMYEDLVHYPQYARWRGIEEKLLQEIQQCYKEQVENVDVVLVYSAAEENKIKKIMLENKREFGEW